MKPYPLVIDKTNSVERPPNLRRALSLLLGLASIAMLAAGCESSRKGTSAASAAASMVSPPTQQTQAAATPQSALAELKAGNARFVAGTPINRNTREDVKATASGQYPLAAVLSCLDSRKPIEIVLDQGVGDIFSARVAGNVVNDDILGSMEFACKVAGAKLIAVLGHSNCGAVKGAVDNVELGNLTGLLKKIEPAASQVPESVQPRTSKNLQFVDQVAEANVRLAMQQIRERSPTLREMLDHHQIAIVGGMYDLSTGNIHFFEK
jgi:carbonic anhydrase